MCSSPPWRRSSRCGARRASRSGSTISNRGARVLEAVGELRSGPPGVQRDDDRAEGSRRPEGRHPLGQVAHRDRHTVAGAHPVAIRERPGEGGSLPEVRSEGHALVLVDEKRRLPVVDRPLQDRPQRRGTVRPDPRTARPSMVSVPTSKGRAGAVSSAGGFGEAHRHARAAYSGPDVEHVPPPGAHSRHSARRARRLRISKFPLR